MVFAVDCKRSCVLCLYPSLFLCLSLVSSSLLSRASFLYLSFQIQRQTRTITSMIIQYCRRLLCSLERFRSYVRRIEIDDRWHSVYVYYRCMYINVTTMYSDVIKHAPLSIYQEQNKYQSSILYTYRFCLQFCSVLHPFSKTFPYVVRSCVCVSNFDKIMFS